MLTKHEELGAYIIMHTILMYLSEVSAFVTFFPHLELSMDVEIRLFNIILDIAYLILPGCTNNCLMSYDKPATIDGTLLNYQETVTGGQTVPRWSEMVRALRVFLVPPGCDPTSLTNIVFMNDAPQLY